MLEAPQVECGGALTSDENMSLPTRRMTCRRLILAMAVCGVCGCKEGSRVENESAVAPLQEAHEADYDIDVERWDISGFWVLTPLSRKALGEMIDRLPAPDPESGTIPMSSDDVGMRTCIIAFNYGFERAFGITDPDGNPLKVKTGMMDKFPLGYGNGASTLFPFSWTLNKAGDPPETMFSPRHAPIESAKNWLDIRYFPAPSMSAFQRYYILKRGEHYRLQRKFSLEGSDEVIILEWRSLEEPEG